MCPCARRHSHDRICPLLTSRTARLASFHAQTYWVYILMRAALSVSFSIHPLIPHSNFRNVFQHECSHTIRQLSQAQAPCLRTHRGCRRRSRVDQHRGRSQPRSCCPRRLRKCVQDAKGSLFQETFAQEVRTRFNNLSQQVSNLHKFAEAGFQKFAISSVHTILPRAPALVLPTLPTMRPLFPLPRTPTSASIPQASLPRRVIPYKTMPHILETLSATHRGSLSSSFAKCRAPFATSQMRRSSDRSTSNRTMCSCALVPCGKGFGFLAQTGIVLQLLQQSHAL